MPESLEGYDLEFVERSDKHVCPVCLLVLREPMQTECGHRFCKACITKWLRESSARCPIDNQALSINQLFPDNFAKREILALSVKCPNHLEGCETITVLKHLQSHLSECTYAFTPCPNECANLVRRVDLTSHLLSSCPKRNMECPLCQLQFPADFSEEHMRCCPMVEVACPSECKAMLPRRQLSQHINSECPRTNVRCQYSMLGCHFESERQEMTDHEEASMREHMSLLNRHLVQLITILNINPTANQTVHRPSSLGIQPGETPTRSGAASFPMCFSQHRDQSNITMLQQIFNRVNVSEVSLSSGGLGSVAGYQASGLQGMPRSQSMPLSDSMLTTQHLPNNVLEPEAEAACADSHTEHAQNNNTNTRSVKHSFESKPSNRQDKEMFFGTEFSEYKSFKCQNEIQDESLAIHDQKILQLEQQNQRQENIIRELKTKIRHLENTVADFEGRAGNGTFLWKIKNYYKLRREAEKGETTAIHSNSFYSSFNGYKMCIRVNMNGVDAARGTHLSVFVHFMQGEFDEILEWPFSGRIILTIIDQNPICELRHHMSETLLSKPNLAAFQRPNQSRNHKGFGYMEFMPLSVIDGSMYVRNDTLIIKVNIIPST